MIEPFDAMTFWHWFVFGAILMALEIMVMGMFLLWIGLAAILVGILMLVIPTLTWPLAISFWAIMSVASVVGWVAYRKKNPAAAKNNVLNQRGTELIGQEYTLSAPIQNGKGEVRAGDTMWRIVSDTDIPGGTRIRVIGLDGTSLRVELAP
jgi:membrane protein implicated in regulation of membrane protease activity